MGLLDDSTQIPVAAYKAEPFSVAELDAHQDAARVWATVRAMRAEFEIALAEAHEQGLSSGYNAAYGEGVR